MRRALFALALIGCGGGGGGGNDGGNVIADADPFRPDAAGVGSCQIFPADNPWNTRIDNASFAVHERSDAFVDNIGRGTGLHADFGTFYEGAPIGIPWITVPGDQPRVPVTFDEPDESDPGPYPIPPDAPIEGGPDSDGDRHILVIDVDDCVLYETFATYPDGDGWTAFSGAIFDLNSNELRPDRWTSADAAGLPIFPGLVRYEEVVEQGVIDHAVRFTVSQTQAGYINPATHAASDDTDPDRPPMGLRMRMKSDYDCSGLSQEVQVICTALKQYGMLMADNGSDWYISGDHDPRWDDEALSDIAQITGDAFEAVYTGDVTAW